MGHAVARVGLSPIEGAVLVDAKGMLLIGAEQIVAHEVVVLVSVAAKLQLISLFFVGRYAEGFVFIVISDEIMMCDVADKIKDNLSKALNIKSCQIYVKGKTTEGENPNQKFIKALSCILFE